MIEVFAIKALEENTLLCTFNNGEQRLLNLDPILDNQKFLTGINKLRDAQTFRKVRVGDLGQIYWENIIEIKASDSAQIWDYDISPEFAYANSRHIK